MDELHEAERAVDLPQLGGRDVGLQLVGLAPLHRSFAMHFVLQMRVTWTACWLVTSSELAVLPADANEAVE